MMKVFTARGANQPFTCNYCGAHVPPLSRGGIRNHCPYCLRSEHVDINPGDRAADCGGVLEPVAVDHSGKKGWIIVQRCSKCGVSRRNKAALDDEKAPDDYQLLIELARKLPG